MPQFQSPTHMTETKIKSARAHNWDDKRWDSNSWWTNHMLGDIWFSTQLLVTHLVTTLLSVIIATFLEYTGCRMCGANQQNEYTFSLYVVKQSEKTCSFCSRMRWHLIMTIVMITDRKCLDQMTDQELVAHNVTKHVMIATTVWVSPRIIAVELVTLTLFCFSRNLPWLCQWHSKKGMAKWLTKRWLLRMYWSNQLFEHQFW